MKEFLTQVGEYSVRDGYDVVDIVGYKDSLYIISMSSNSIVVDKYVNNRQRERWIIQTNIRGKIRVTVDKIEFEPSLIVASFNEDMIRVYGYRLYDNGGYVLHIDENFPNSVANDIYYPLVTTGYGEFKFIGRSEHYATETSLDHTMKYPIELRGLRTDAIQYKDSYKLVSRMNDKLLFYDPRKHTRFNSQPIPGTNNDMISMLTDDTMICSQSGRDKVYIVSPRNIKEYIGREKGAELKAVSNGKTVYSDDKNGRIKLYEYDETFISYL